MYNSEIESYYFNWQAGNKIYLAAKPALTDVRPFVDLVYSM